MRKALTATLILLIGLSVRHHAQGVAAAQPAQAAASKDTALEARIHRVEHGLLPAVVIKGAPPVAMELAARMQFYKVPGMSVAVINGGRVEWARGYGVKEAGKNEPVTPETLFQAGSISKPVAALAALRLVQEGRLNLDEDVNAKLVSWHVPENEQTREQKVTLRRLLSHSAGLTVHGFPGYAAGTPVPTLVQVLDGVKPANTEAVRVDTVPGTLWRYSGGGYTVMQQLLIDVVRKPFPELMRQMVIEPLGLRHSTYEQPPPAPFAAMAATAHNNGQPIEGRWHVYPEMAAAGLWTTPTDLALIAIELQQALAGRSDKVLAPATVRQMVTAQMKSSGLGPMVMGTGPTARFSHGGVDEGFEASWVAYETTSQGAVVMTNGSGGGALAEEILRAIAREYNWLDFAPRERTLATVDPQTLDAYTGTYEFHVSPAVTIKLVVTTGQGRLHTSQEGAPTTEWLPFSETEFFRTASETTLQFVKDAQGRVSELVIYQSGDVYRGRKIKP
ncbi:MAG TPA: serine hydrolase [Thermoanaerobaculia bacterium]|jgi:CubicO group peptidase (beta-lactamase class C family)|nr:serine hydrolase [Thermoanaerobaculia bacterium]